MEPENKLPARQSFGVGGKNKSVQTFAEDMANVIESDQGGGLIKKIIHEEEEHEIEKKNLSPESRKNRIFLTASLLFVFAAVVLLAYLIINRKEAGTVAGTPQFAPLIFTDKTAFIEVSELSREKIAEAIWGEISTGAVKEGGALGVYLIENQKIISWSRFLEIIKASLTKDKAALFNDNFLLGSVNRDTMDLFILLQTKSFTEVFNEMRAWEAKMFYDLHSFWGIEVNASTNYLLTKNFEDGIIQNKNARILYDDTGNIVMMYVFVDDSSLIITKTEDATAEVMLRLAGSKVKK